MRPLIAIAAVLAGGCEEKDRREFLRTCAQICAPRGVAVSLPITNVCVCALVVERWPAVTCTQLDGGCIGP